MDWDDEDDGSADDIDGNMDEDAGGRCCFG